MAAGASNTNCYYLYINAGARIIDGAYHSDYNPYTAQYLYVMMVLFVVVIEKLKHGENINISNKSNHYNKVNCVTYILAMNL